MNSFRFKKLALNLSIIFFLFFVDRISKIYILNIAENIGTVDIYINNFLNLILVWNTGVGFGILSFEEKIAYNLITGIIIIVNLIIIILIIKSEDFKIYFYLIILGGSLGNLFDRIYYSAVPDFIDIHFNNYHWFIFNLADIFITIGIICLIFVEMIYKKKS
tara:strand:+ start:1096 stop:1581 length:486 start_codon:yes stop_codon:yes gene_type:complete